MSGFKLRRGSSIHPSRRSSVLLEHFKCIDLFDRFPLFEGLLNEMADEDVHWFARFDFLWEFPAGGRFARELRRYAEERDVDGRQFLYIASACRKVRYLLDRGIRPQDLDEFEFELFQLDFEAVERAYLDICHKIYVGRGVERYLRQLHGSERCGSSLAGSRRGSGRELLRGPSLAGSSQGSGVELRRTSSAGSGGSGDRRCSVSSGGSGGC